MKNKVSTHLYLDSHLHRKIYLLAKLKKLSMAEVVREILAENIDKKKAKKVGSRLLEKLSRYKVRGPKDLSGNYKKYLFD